MPDKDGVLQAGGRDGVADAGGGQLTLGTTPQEWRPQGNLTVPPGTVPMWEGSPESVVAALEATKRPHRVEPDGYGGVIPGVASPLWGGTEPLSRFEPGPKDDWGAWDFDDDTPNRHFSTPSPQAPDTPPFIDWSAESAGIDSASDAHDPDVGGVGGNWTIRTARDPGEDWGGD